MNRTSYRFLILAFTLALFSGGAAFAAEKPGKAEKQKRQEAAAKARQAEEQYVGKLKQELALSDDQQKKVAELVSEHALGMRVYRKVHATEIKAIGEKLKKARESKNKTDAKFAADEMKALYAKGPQRTEMLGKIRALLTPDQQGKFDQMPKEGKAKAKAPKRAKK